MDTVLSMILLVSDMLKVPRAKLEANFLKKLTYVTNNYLAHEPLENVQGQQETFQNTQ